jgi:hypothetical protein
MPLWRRVDFAPGPQMWQDSLYPERQDRRYKIYRRP